MQRTTKLPRGVTMRREQRARRGDLVILTADRRFPREAFDHLREQCDRVTARSGVQFIVIEDGLTAQIVKRASA